MALSADGNTALIGGPDDNGSVGAAWVFTRSGGTWTQQGAKLTGTGETGTGRFGSSVALSADGNTALIGGPADNGSVGAAWVFTRSGGAWTQQGAKLTGSGEIGAGEFGFSVALSADGNTALIGGPGDNGDAGAAWVFTRSGRRWTQQGAKLTGSGEVGPAEFGVGVALSADGNTALIGGDRRQRRLGSGVGVHPLGRRLDAAGREADRQRRDRPGRLRRSASALSADGNTALIGGDSDNNVAGAAWVFTRSGIDLDASRARS